MKKTLENLAKAFISESQARNRYTMFAKTAKKEGFEQIAAVFEETADQEREHAKWLFRMICDLNGKEKTGEIKVESRVPFVCGSTIDNLAEAINGENYEHTQMYPQFAETAEEEGLTDVAARLRSIAIAETHHEERYKKLKDVFEESSVFKKKEEKVWICRKCGYMKKGNEAPSICSSCGHPQGYFQTQNETY
ncbi:MAG: ferritin family protein [Patescibacteria group bacterium]|nr:ferritin family protein [Patescibacteria group bacterium]